MIEEKKNEGKPKGCLPAVIIFAVIISALVASIWYWSVSTPGGAVFLSVIRGEKGIEDLTTKLIMDSIMKKNGVPEAEYRELEERMGDIKPVVNEMNEGEKKVLADKIRSAAEDGHLSDGEIEDIVSYMDSFANERGG